MSRHEEVQRIAYRLWEEERRPQGRALQHWLKAEAIWENQHEQKSQSLHSDLPKQLGESRRRSAQT
jgi:hypothetical protein